MHADMFEEKETTQVEELDKIETSDYKKQESLERIDGLEILEGNSGEKDFKLESIIDVSGQRLDFPLIDGEEREVDEMYMYKNEFCLIPRAVGRLKGLKTVKFFSNEVNLFPREFNNLVGLECLQVKVMVPGVSGLELGKLKSLKELELSRVPPRPSAFPILSQITGLKCLNRLSLCHFSIRYLPPEIGCLNNLEYLDLSFNKMRNLPDEITSLNLLTSLKLANNKLIELPLRISNLQRLENLDLSNNRLISVDFLELESMCNLQTLNLQHNQLHDCQIPSWICCNLVGNSVDHPNDELADMDVYEGSSIAPLSHLSGLSSSNQPLASRRANRRKHRYNFTTKGREKRINSCKKWKIDASNRSSSEKCATCRLSVHGGDTPSGCVSFVEDANVDNKCSLPASEVHGNPPGSPGNEDFTPKKECMDGCSCSATVSDGIRNKVEADGSDSNAISSSPSDSVGVLDESSSSELSVCWLKSKRHSDKDLDNPKPTKSRRPTSESSFLSRQYSEISFCGVGDFLPDGFYDAGRDRPFMPLDSFDRNLPVNSREVILLDRERDEELYAILARARSLVCQFKHRNSSIHEHRDIATQNLQIVSLLALFVSDHFGGSDKSDIVRRARKAASGSNCSKPFVCTCRTGINGDASMAAKRGSDTAEDVVFLDICENSLRCIKERRNSSIVPIGGLQFGVCRHRALLMKYLCDRMEPRIPCELVRGYLDFLPHAWNVIIIKRGKSLVRLLVDACLPHDIREETDPEYYCRYIPLSRVSAVVADKDASPNCSFPSLSVHNKIGKLGSTSLMRCDVGSLEAAVKVRAIDISGASADEVRNFELTCLGEVRILSVLKHSCIVEFHGHQISSKWSATADGNSAGRTLQSAILMEYVKGGSLKSFVEKISSSGEKHIPLDLAVSIARDVSYALTELHAKLIIHRDIKSENILIDLEKKRLDGSPTVKICDFDRAIPLHAYLHTCCIAHAGIPSADICVGTPRWMAPEVFHAMHKRNIYGLEVDIWSFGCLLLELLTLQVPYYGLTEMEIHNCLQKGERPQPTDELEALAESDDALEAESETLNFLVKLYHRCTEKNPANRPSAENVYNLLLAHASLAAGSTSPEQD